VFKIHVTFQRVGPVAGHAHYGFLICRGSGYIRRVQFMYAGIRNGYITLKIMYLAKWYVKISAVKISFQSSKTHRRCNGIHLYILYLCLRCRNIHILVMHLATLHVFTLVHTSINGNS